MYSMSSYLHDVLPDRNLRSALANLRQVSARELLHLRKQLTKGSLKIFSYYMETALHMTFRGIDEPVRCEDNFSISRRPNKWPETEQSTQK